MRTVSYSARLSRHHSGHRGRTGPACQGRRDDTRTCQVNEGTPARTRIFVVRVREGSGERVEFSELVEITSSHLCSKSRVNGQGKILKLWGLSVRKGTVLNFRERVCTFAFVRFCISLWRGGLSKLRAVLFPKNITRRFRASSPRPGRRVRTGRRHGLPSPAAPPPPKPGASTLPLPAASAQHLCPDVARPPSPVGVGSGEAEIPRRTNWHSSRFRTRGDLSLSLLPKKTIAYLDSLQISAGRAGRRDTGKGCSIRGSSLSFPLHLKVLSTGKAPRAAADCTAVRTLCFLTGAFCSCSPPCKRVGGKTVHPGDASAPWPVTPRLR